jgi:hypothetical protein
MLYVREDGRLAAKLADLGTAVQLSSADALIAEPMGTTGYAGEYLLRLPHVYF